MFIDRIHKQYRRVIVLNFFVMPETKIIIQCIINNVIDVSDMGPAINAV